MTENKIPAAAAAGNLPAWRLCTFGERAEALRRERGISKAELCRRLGISVTYYDLIIHGRRSGTAHRQRILNMAGGGYAGGNDAAN